MAWTHILIRGVRMGVSDGKDGKLYRLIMFGQDPHGNDTTWSVWVNANKENRASFSDNTHLLIAIVKTPGKFVEYVKAIQNGDKEAADALRGEFFDACRKAATRFATGAAEDNTDLMNQVASGLNKLLQGRVFMVDWVQDGEYGKPGKHALPVNYSVWQDRIAEEPFGEKMASELVEEFEEGGDYYTFDDAFHDGQRALLEGDAEINEGLAALMAAEGASAEKDAKPASKPAAGKTKAAAGKTGSKAAAGKTKAARRPEPEPDPADEDPGDEEPEDDLVGGDDGYEDDEPEPEPEPPRRRTKAAATTGRPTRASRKPPADDESDDDPF